MATSQNGWPAYSSGTHPDLVAIPHVAGRVRRGDVATIFTYLVSRFDREVEDVDEARGQPEDDWGWASRPIRGNETGLSNHASGTAIDLNAPRHPLGKVGTFSPTQRAALRRILNDLGGVVRWGGDYSGRKDEMHFEINANAARVAQVARSLASHVSNPIAGGGTVTNPTLPGGIPTAPAKDWFTMATVSDLASALKSVLDTSWFRDMVYNTVWVFPRWTVPGTDRKENPGQYVSATRVLAVQAVTEARQAKELAKAAAEGRRLTEDEIADIGARIAAQVAEETKNLTVEDIVSRVSVDLSVKE